MAGAEAQTAGEGGNVVLKVRRRKFGRTPARMGEITVTRRLFRSGESEYLLNGKICRLRDIQDIFMGTGLGGESYAIIGQERIGQLLSSKPLDAAPSSKRLPASRVSRPKAAGRASARVGQGQSLRVNDIFEEVVRQVAVLKRQAPRPNVSGNCALNSVARLRVVLASRLAQMDAESEMLRINIARLGKSIEGQQPNLRLWIRNTRPARRAAMRSTASCGKPTVAQLGRRGPRTHAGSHWRQHRSRAELAQRIAAANDELAGAREALAHLAGEREQHRSFLETATAEANAHKAEAGAQQARAHEAMRGVLAAEAMAEQGRRNAMNAVGRASSARSEIAQAEAALAGLDRENERLSAESDAARHELEALGQQRGPSQARLRDCHREAKAARSRDPRPARTPGRAPHERNPVPPPRR